MIPEGIGLLPSTYFLTYLMPPDNYSILLVDDDLGMLRLLEQLLQRAGYVVRAVADGQEAIEAIESECPDILLTDWEMPRMTGIELCRFVRNMRLPHYIYILLLTVRSDSAEIISGLEAGADDYITKPAHEGQLLARVQSGLRVIDTQRQLTLMAHIDPITGLLMRRGFYEQLEKEWCRAKRSKLPLSCAMLDLDSFKPINDTYGHHIGDSVLKHVAELLVENCRFSDSVCRYGGDEFCIMLPEASETDAMQWAERARHCLASRTIHTRCGDIRLSGSFGVAQCHEGIKSVKELIDLADQALLRAKRTGRNCVIRYSADSLTPAINGLSN